MLTGILQAGHMASELMASCGDYDALFHRLLEGQGQDFRTWNVVDMDFPEGPDAADAWLITGSRHGVYDALPFIAPLEALIREIYAAGKPLVGICFGHQIIAQALGGAAGKHPGGWSVGRKSYDLMGREVALNAWHQDQVSRPPEGAQTVASNDFCAHAALLYGDRVFTVQAHPEFTREVLDGLIRYRGPGVVPEEDLRGAADGLEAPLDNATLGQMIGQFLRERRIS